MIDAGTRATGEAPALGELLAQAIEALGTPRDEARVDAEILLAEATGRPRHHFWARAEDRPSPRERTRFLALVERRRTGEPVAHILGRRGFWTFDLEVDASTLIPRPETERIVEIVLGLDLPGTGVRVLDLGTGSGAIAIALAHERPGWSIVASDVSGESLALAARNARRLGAVNVRLRRGDWFGAAGAERFTLIVSNPPYVAAGDAHLERGDLRHEPPLALVAGPDGLAALRAIAEGAAGHLEPGGWLVLEHGFDQGEAVRGLLAASGLEDPRTFRDLAARERVTLARSPG